MSNGPIFTLPELQNLPQGEMNFPVLLSMLMSNDALLEDTVERAAQQAPPPPAEAIQQPVPRLPQGVGPGPDDPQATLPGTPPGELIPLEGAQIPQGQAGPPQTVAPQARSFVSQGSPAPRSDPLVPGPNAQSSAYLQSLMTLLQGSRLGGQ